MHFFLKVPRVHRYYNDPVFLTKLGKEMGVGIPSDTPVSNEWTDANEGEENNGDEDDDDLTVHHTASVGDVQVCLFFKYFILHLCWKFLFILNKKHLHFGELQVATGKKEFSWKKSLLKVL